MLLVWLKENASGNQVGDVIQKLRGCSNSKFATDNVKVNDLYPGENTCGGMG